MKKVIPIRNPKSRIRKENERWLLMSPNGKLLYLNDMGALIFSLCNGKMNVGQIVEQVSKSLSFDDKRIEEDIYQFVKEISTTKAVVLVGKKYIPPKITVATPTGEVDINDVDIRIFIGDDMRADPPCQMY